MCVCVCVREREKEERVIVVQFFDQRLQAMIRRNDEDAVVRDLTWLASFKVVLKT